VEYVVKSFDSTNCHHIPPVEEGGGAGRARREAVAGEERRTALLALEDLGTHYVAGGLMGLELRWGARTVRLGEDKAYLRWLGEWLGLATARQPEEKVLQDQQGIGIDGERVMEKVGSGGNKRERQLGEEVQKFRDEDQEWLRCGVITTPAERVTGCVAGVDRRKGQGLTEGAGACV
jgi:hypothetical protein